jgi:hypothetical protein
VGGEGIESWSPGGEVDSGAAPPGGAVRGVSDGPVALVGAHEEG